MLLIYTLLHRRCLGFLSWHAHTLTLSLQLSVLHCVYGCLDAIAAICMVAGKLRDTRRNGGCVLFLELLQICTLSTNNRCMCVHVHHWSSACICLSPCVRYHWTILGQHLNQIYVSLDCLCILNLIVIEIYGLDPGASDISKWTYAVRWNLQYTLRDYYWLLEVSCLWVGIKVLYTVVHI